MIDTKVLKKKLVIILTSSIVLIGTLLHVFRPEPFIPLTQLELENASIKYADRIQELKKLFVPSSIIIPPHIVSCRLSRGTEILCFSVTVKVSPGDFTPGPWCPRNITDSDEQGGIWLDDGKVYDVDGAFIKNLDKFYNDDNWQLFDENTGIIKVTDTEKTCPAAARPNVDKSLHNHCVECETSYMGENASMTYTIPLNPQHSNQHADNTRFNGVGISFSGARLDGPAPLNDILKAHTIAPLDDCGGHVNIHVGYHIHAVTGCVKEYETENNHAPLIGMAMDGFPIHTRLNKSGEDPQDLDRCRGHDFEDLGYHYHVAGAGKNQILPCFNGENGCTSSDPDEICDASRPMHPPR